MKTSAIVELIKSEGSLTVSRNANKDYILRKQCRRLVDNGVLSCETTTSSFKYTQA